MKKTVSIVIRANNEPTSLARVMKAIYSQKKIKPLEVILIDSKNNLDYLYRLIRKYHINPIEISQENFTHAWTFNLGVKNSLGEIVVFISAHCVPHDNYWLYNLVKHFENKRVGGVFGAQIPIKEVNLIDEFKLVKMFPLDGKESPAKFSNANGAMRRNLLLKHPYDERVTYQYMGGEDQKIINPIKLEGYSIIYEPSAKVYHSHPYSLKSRLKSMFIAGYYSKEFGLWNQGINTLNYKRTELINYLLVRKAYQELIVQCFFDGILIRIANYLGKIKRTVDEKMLKRELIPFYKIQQKKYLKRDFRAPRGRYIQQKS